MKFVSLFVLSLILLRVDATRNVFAVPVSQLSTGRIKVSLISDISYTWSFKNGSMLVNISNLPIGSWLIEAKRKNRLGMIVNLGRQEISNCSGQLETIEVEVWPTEGKVFQSDTYPIIERLN